MPRYAITVSLSAERLPDLEPQKAIDPGKDPINNMTEMLGKMVSTMAPPNSPMMFHRPSGMQVSKNIEISVESFLALAEVLNRFDHLAEEIECSNPPGRPW
jgi:hypothetical protein